MLTLSHALNVPVSTKKDPRFDGDKVAVSVLLFISSYSSPPQKSHDKESKQLEEEEGHVTNPSRSEYVLLLFIELALIPSFSPISAGVSRALLSIK